MKPIRFLLITLAVIAPNFVFEFLMGAAADWKHATEIATFQVFALFWFMLLAYASSETSDWRD